MERARYQFGSLTRKKRAKGSDAWEFRYYESTAKNSRIRKTATVGSVDKYKNEALAQKAVEALLLTLNSETPQQRMAVVTFGAICDRYVEEELPERYSTAKSYQSNIKNHLKPRWGDYLLDKIRPMAVEDVDPRFDSLSRAYNHPGSNNRRSPSTNRVAFRAAFPGAESRTTGHP